MNKTIIFLFVVYILSGFGHDMYMDKIDLMDLSAGESSILFFIGLARIISLYGGFFLLALSLFIATHKHPSKSNRLSYISCMLVGICYCVAMSYMNSIVSKVNTERPSIMKSHPDFLTTYENYLKSNRAFDEEYLSVNKQMASTLFVDEGLVVDTIDKSGNRIKYIPTEEDKEMRRNNIRAYELLEWSKSSMKESVYLCWSFLLFTFLASYFHKIFLSAYNNLFNRDAASGG